MVIKSMIYNDIRMIVKKTIYHFSYQRNKTQELLDTILSIQPKESSSGGGETREASVYRQSKEMLEKVPPNFDPHEVKER